MFFRYYAKRFVFEKSIHNGAYYAFFPSQYVSKDKHVRQYSVQLTNEVTRPVTQFRIIDETTIITTIIFIKTFSIESDVLFEMYHKSRTSTA